MCTWRSFLIFTAHQILLRWRLKGLGSVVRVGEKEKCNKVLLGGGEPEGKGPFESCVNGSIILKSILQNWNAKAWTGFITAHDRKKVTGCCEHCEKTSGSINCLEFLDKADGLLVFQGFLSKELRSY
jgi:hypothetical protein